MNQFIKYSSKQYHSRSHALRGNARPGHSSVLSHNTGAPSSVFPRRAWEREKTQGFTLIEVLVAMFVLALGLLGLAGLQAHALKNNQSAYHRSQATQLAYDIADRMRANLTEAQKFATSQYDSDVLAPTDATNQANCKTTTGCTPIQMAEQDLFDWNKNLKDWLPLGTGTINATSPRFTVTISWDDNHDGDVDSDDPNFTMSFQL